MRGYNLRVLASFVRAAENVLKKIIYKTHYKIKEEYLENIMRNAF